jgi:hypothetical protein
MLMPMLRNTCTLFCGFLLSTSWAATFHTDKLGRRYQMPAHKPFLGSHTSKSRIVKAYSKTQSFRNFTGIDARGNIDLIIHGRRHTLARFNPRAHAMPDPDNEGQLKNRRVMWESNGVLYIDNPAPYKRIKITLTVPQLASLTVDGAVHVVGDHIKSQGFILSDSSSDDVMLGGMMNVASVTAHGSGNISLRWVKSSLLTVNSDGQGIIRMSGLARVLRAKLSNKSVFDGQFLRVKEAMVRTTQEAAANIFPINAVQAFAYDFSNIYLYHAPKSLNRITMQSGNVFQKDWRL